MTHPRSSRINGFYRLSPDERLKCVAEFSDLNPAAVEAFSPANSLALEKADHMIENVIGVFCLPLGIAVNFIVNHREVLVPMAIEEPSVVAGSSFMAKLARAGGGFFADTTEPQMIAQIQVLDVPDLAAASESILEHKSELCALADQVNPFMVELGGGARDIEVRILNDTPIGSMLIVHLIYDTRDAMGANTINSAAEQLAPHIEILSGGRTHLRILSNLADRRLAWARVTIPAEVLAFNSFSGERVRDGIIEAWAFAEADPYRAATHNKGIMNGIDSVLIATGNDWRATEAGAHAYAARSGRYTSLSRWFDGKDGALVGELKLPLAIGTVGGSTRVHPTAKACLELMRVQNARELAEIVVSVGLAQNLAALRALATEGIQHGHMRLHARQVALVAGATGDLINRVAEELADEGKINISRAKELVQKWTHE